jgi:hypothetical protein
MSAVFHARIEADGLDYDETLRISDEVRALGYLDVHVFEAPRAVQLLISEAWGNAITIIDADETFDWYDPPVWPLKDWARADMALTIEEIAKRLARPFTFEFVFAGDQSKNSVELTLEKLQEEIRANRIANRTTWFVIPGQNG